MARSGAKPKPPALKILTGNPGKRPIPEGVRAPAECPVEPHWLDLLPAPDVVREGDEADHAQLLVDCSAEWLRIVPTLDQLGLLSGLDRMVLVEAAVTGARIMECERRLSRQGLMMLVVKRGRNGDEWTEWVRHPLSVTVREYRSAHARLVGELGLSPSARGRLQGGEKQEDGFDIFD